MSSRQEQMTCAYESLQNSKKSMHLSNISTQGNRSLTDPSYQWQELRLKYHRPRRTNSHLFPYYITPVITRNVFGKREFAR